MPYDFVANSFHTNKLCSRLFFKRSAILDEYGSFGISSPHLRGLGATYDHHLRIIGKRIVNFLLVLI